ncbi:terminal beta-(1-_2)-arabinofuranosyltransferase [Yinghuangia aomiensis]|uniref:Terminal beta-(1->2)-arabinofuranosyltransferase n=1 Tax=Yinghuangia aomiensis TaxID=676205 RepID=A0ABP9IFK6_9ACTN
MTFATPFHTRLRSTRHSIPVDPRRAATAAAITACVVVFAAEVYARRWISDDGLIAVRQVRQVLAGHRPTYSTAERDEVNTSVLWTWLLVAVSAVCGGEPALQAVWAGGILSVGALAVALDASRRFQRSRGADGMLLPAGVLVVLGVIPFWDYGTSGLETGLCFFWLSGSWALLAAVKPDSTPRRRHGTAFALGLGPLVRPEFAIASAAFLVALTLLAGARARKILSIIAVAGVLPVAYEIFRAGYYGILIPMPGLAKEASNTHWGRGFGYFDDFLTTYKLWIPLALLCVLITHLYGRARPSNREVVLVATPVLAASLMCVYVLRVGGDYMHARMWLPLVLLMLLPLFLVPFSRTTGVVVALTAVWATAVGVNGRTSYHNLDAGPQLITNEREFEAAFFGHKHPARAADHLGGDWGAYLEQAVDTARGSAIPVLLYMAHDNATDKDYLTTVPLAPGRTESFAFFWDNMGMTSVLTSLDQLVIDRNGLATPISGHLRLDHPGRAGHEKSLSLVWVLAKYADPVAVTRV